MRLVLVIAPASSSRCGCALRCSVLPVKGLGTLLLALPQFSFLAPLLPLVLDDCLAEVELLGAERLVVLVLLAVVIVLAGAVVDAAVLRVRLDLGGVFLLDLHALEVGPNDFFTGHWRRLLRSPRSLRVLVFRRLGPLPYIELVLRRLPLHEVPVSQATRAGQQGLSLAEVAALDAAGRILGGAAGLDGGVAIGLGLLLLELLGVGLLLVVLFLIAFVLWRDHVLLEPSVLSHLLPASLLLFLVRVAAQLSLVLKRLAARLLLGAVVVVGLSGLVAVSVGLLTLALRVLLHVLLLHVLRVRGLLLLRVVAPEAPRGHVVHVRLLHHLVRTLLDIKSAQ